MSNLLLLILLLLSLYGHASNARNYGGALCKDSCKMLKTSFKEGHASVSIRKSNDSGALTKIKDETKGMAEGVVRKELVDTVSWTVPHKNHEKNPRFDLDYAPPRTHPPSHN